MLILSKVPQHALVPKGSDNRSDPSAGPRIEDGGEERALPLPAEELPCGKATILIVDDEPDIRSIVRILLEAGGSRILEAATGPEAVTLAGQGRPDLIILDWMLPELSGLEVARCVRRDPASAAIPIIMLTSKGRAHAARALEAGANAYLTKPFSPLELRHLVDSMLEERSAMPPVLS